MVMDELVSVLLQYFHTKEDESLESMNEQDGDGCPFEAAYHEGRTEAYAHVRAFITGTYLDYKNRLF
jgi:hypothetical protein